MKSSVTEGSEIGEKRNGEVYLRIDVWDRDRVLHGPIGGRGV